MTDMAVMSAEMLANRITALPERDQMTVSNVLSGIEGRKRRYFKTDYLGLLSLKLGDLFDMFRPKSDLTDDEIDEIIASVRKERRARADSHRH